MPEAKQVIVIRRDLKMRRGKEIAQGSHASMAWLTDRLSAGPEFPSHHDGSPRSLAHGLLTPAERQWCEGSFTKVVCQVATYEEFREIVQRARDAGVLVHVITDAGHTEFHGVPTETALAVGPDWADRVDGVTGGLSLY